MLKRRKFIGKIAGLLGGALLYSPYVSALEHLESLEFSKTIDPMQKFLIDSNVEFLLASDCGVGGNTPCEELWCSDGPAAKAKNCP